MILYNLPNINKEKKKILISCLKIQIQHFNMKKLKIGLVLFAGTFAFQELTAQNISGKLVDENNQPLPYANVVLLSLPDSTFISGTISNEMVVLHCKPHQKNRLYAFLPSVMQQYINLSTQLIWASYS